MLNRLLSYFQKKPLSMGSAGSGKAYSLEDFNYCLKTIKLLHQEGKVTVKVILNGVPFDVETNSLFNLITSSVGKGCEFFSNGIHSISIKDLNNSIMCYRMDLVIDSSKLHERGYDLDDLPFVLNWK